MTMYNLIEYSDNYSKASWILWQYCRCKPAINTNNIFDFNPSNTTNSFKTNEKWQTKQAKMGQKR